MFIYSSLNLEKQIPLKVTTVFPPPVGSLLKGCCKNLELSRDKKAYGAMDQDLSSFCYGYAKHFCPLPNMASDSTSEDSVWTSMLFFMFGI